MNKDIWFDFVRENIIPEDKDEIERAIDDPLEDRDMNFIECFDCKMHFLVVRKLGKGREVSCPKCGCKLKIKFFKNGSISIRRIL